MAQSTEKTSPRAGSALIPFPVPRFGSASLGTHHYQASYRSIDRVANRTEGCAWRSGWGAYLWHVGVQMDDAVLGP